MIKVRGLDIYFRHKAMEEGYTNQTLNGREVKTPYLGVTECIAELDGELQFEGIAYCSLNDKFTKSAGRKVALAKAIEHLDRELRREIWEAYIKETSNL